MTPPAPLRRAVLPLLLGIAALAVAPQGANAAVCTPPVVNKVACENSKTGSPPEEWYVDGAGEDTVQGYATAMSVNVGQTINFKIKSNTSAYTISIYRLGYYNGDGARLIQGGLTPTGTSTQPDCPVTVSTGLVDCGNWSVTRSWTVPSDSVSGVYVARLAKNDGSGASHITFVVRDDSSHSDLVVQTSDATWQAYNTYGGNSLYDCTPAQCPPEGNPRAYKAAYKVSYNRPFHTAGDDGGRSWLFSGAEYPMIRFLEQQGYDISYMASMDVARRGALLVNHKLFISSGHDEYWSASQRTSMANARDAGVNLAFFSGNTGFWKTRWENDSSGNQDRIITSYKDTHFDTRQDPVEWTGTWRDPRFTQPSENVTPENALLGASFLVNSGTSLIRVPYEYGRLRLWRNTAAATLAVGGSLALAPSTLGYEWDVDADNGFRPKGNIRLSSTTVGGLEVFTDYGSTTKINGTATHNMTMYKAPSGALVFNSATVQWAWGLSDQNPDGTPPDVTMQQATVNLFADMGAQPATLQSGLVTATKTTDTAAPTSTITSPPASAVDGTKITISGTASDAGGGRVAGVEISTDGGDTWHPASGGTPTAWTYSWTVHGNPTATIRTRATDDSGNIESPGAGTAVSVTCPCSIWGTTVTPNTLDSGDTLPIEVGVKFKADKLGTIAGLRFYKSAANTGTHVGSLWTAGGTRIAQATFSGETASGWQTVTFSTPVEVQPDTTYVASYFAPNGHYAVTSDYFWNNPAPGPNGGATTDAGPLHALKVAGNANGLSTNGVFAYGAASTFPSNSFGASNYWVDVIYSPTLPPGQVTGVTATSGGLHSANLTWTAPATGGNVGTYRITPYIGATGQTPVIVPGTNTNAPVTGLTTGTTYTFTVQALNTNGSGPVSTSSNAVTPLTPVAPAPPNGVLARPASNQARVTWTASASNGDSAITGQTVTPYIGATAQTPMQVGPSATSATVTGLTNGASYTFRVTATNGVGTSPASPASPAVTPQATIFDFAAPTVVDAGDTIPVELGMKFKADVNGSVSGIRFYKAAANTGTHIGNLWTTSGTRLAQVTFTNESDSGWQTATFSSPVDITAGTTYIASYFTPTGHYSASNGALNTVFDNPPLHTIDNALSSNGVYAYSSSSTFPNSTYGATNYGVDVMVAVPVPGQVTDVTAAAGGMTSANVSWTAPSGGGVPSSYVVTPYIGATAQTPKTVPASATSTTVTGLTNGQTYTFRVKASNANGSGPESAASGSVTPAGAVVPSAPANVDGRPATGQARVTWTASTSDGDSAITGYTVTPYIGATAQAPVQAAASATSATVSGLTNGTAYTFRVTATNGVGTSASSTPSAVVTPGATIFDFSTPGLPDSGDTDSLEVGVKFKADYTGTIMGVRFYKAASNTGAHVGSVWTTGGTRLAQVSFTNETASGWQTAMFTTPVNVTAGTTYVASYFAPNGHYSASSGGLSSAVDNGPLHTIANSVSGNGVYAYGASSTFPGNSYGASNYWVDVVYGMPVPGQVTNVTATAGQASANVSWTAPASGSVTSYTITPYIGSTAQTPKSITGTPPASSATVPGLTPGASYTFRVRASNAIDSGPLSASSNAVTPTGSAAPAVPTAVSATGDSKSATVSWTAPSSDGGSAITGYTVTPYIGATAQAPTNVGGSVTSTRISGLTNHTAYTFRVAATNAVGMGAASAASDAVTPRASILDLGTPAAIDDGDTNSAVLGVKFTASTAGQIVGIRFYKATANTGTHVGALWNAAGGPALASATFVNESASGWQTMLFPTPAEITPGTTYIASYLAPNGHYSATPAAFASGGITNGPLQALSNGTSLNGVYAYSATSVMPTGSYGATNYWVDVLFAPAP